MSINPFQGVIPALMTPCDENGVVNFKALVRAGKRLVDAGMSGVVYCGSMGDWPLLSDEERMEGTEYLVKAGISVVVGTGAQNSKRAAKIAAHAEKIGASGLMVIPRVLSRTLSAQAQHDHFETVLAAAPSLPAVIYNSPYYGFETKAELFFELRAKHKNLVGFKEFGGAEALRYAAESIVNKDPSLILMVGVDTQVFHGYVNCGATGTITGIGNVLPHEVLQFVRFSEKAAAGSAEARRLAKELESALAVLSSFDEGADLVLYYKYLMFLDGHEEYKYHFLKTDMLSQSQRTYAEKQLALFKKWYSDWPGQSVK